MRQGELAQELGVSGAMVTKWKKKGMPVGDVVEAKNWLSIHVPAIHRPAVTGNNLPPKEPASSADQDTWESRLKRSRGTERQTCELLQGAIRSAHAAQIP